MIRKWEWIREYCRRQGFEKSAEIADQIDRVLCYLYEGEGTEEWDECVRSSWESIKETGEIGLDHEEVFYDIVVNDGFCVACERGECGSCMFGNLVGWCGDGGSLFVEFIDKYDDESE
jgi:hypothetical protein